MTRLGPGDMANQNVPPVHIHGDEGGLVESDEPLSPEMIVEITMKLEQLREPFPADMIEKLPKPMFKNAWEGKKGSRCNICHGYHVLDDCIHLDYVGHANTTNRLLKVDPFWDWEPLAFTEAGLPLFDKVGGLWIKLTICGVTRLGYGDGASPKEIIGDAIRNAAMRFGVALDLWSKIDLHAERNPGDGQTPRNKQNTGRGSAGGDAAAVAPQPDEARAPNQDALDSLRSVCDEYGYDTRTMRDDYAQWAKSKRYKDRDLLVAEPDRILAFSVKLIEDATPEPDGGEPDADENQSLSADPSGPAGDGESERGGGGGSDSGDEAQANDPGNMF